MTIARTIDAHDRRNAIEPTIPFNESVDLVLIDHGHPQRLNDELVKTRLSHVATITSNADLMRSKAAVRCSVNPS